MPSIGYWIRRFCLFRQPRWLWYDIGENNWYPNLKEMILRGFWNVLIFLMTIEMMFYLAYVGLKTPFFLLIKEVAQNIGQNEITWLIYGLILGIGGSLLFGSIHNYDKSVLSRFQTSLVYIVYFGLFIIALNLFLWFYAITL